MKLKIKIIAFVISIAAALSLLAGCGGAGSSSGVTVVTTIFPEYDWVKNITEGTGIETVILLGSGSDMHSWQPSADDIMKIVSSDLFIYIGGESDEWVDDILDQHPGVNAVSLLSLLGDAVKEEELVEGMQEDEHEHDHDEEEEHDEHDDHDEGPEYDEHVWMSLRSSAALVSAIADEIAKAAPDSEGAVRAAAAVYIARLEALDAEYQDAVSKAKHDTIIVCDRFPFRYLCDDYGIKYYAAFTGCSAESEASFETVAFLISKFNETGIKSAVVLEGDSHKIADTVISGTDNKDQTIVAIDSMQSVTAQNVKNGADYIDIMKANLDSLKAALESE